MQTVFCKSLCLKFSYTQHFQHVSTLDAFDNRSLLHQTKNDGPQFRLEILDLNAWEYLAQAKYANKRCCPLIRIHSAWAMRLVDNHVQGPPCSSVPTVQRGADWLCARCDSGVREPADGHPPGSSDVPARSWSTWPNSSWAGCSSLSLKAW